MQSRVRSTSREAYHRLDNLGQRQMMVYKCLLDGAKCNLEIAEQLNMPINSITPRTNELVTAGLVREAHKAICKTGRKVMFWEINREPVQEALW